MPEQKKKSVNAGSAIGAIIFLLMAAGGPLLRLLRNVLGGTVALPNNLLPMLLGGLIVLAMLVSAGRALGRQARQRGDVRLPTYAQPPMPFGQARGSQAARSPFDTPAARMPSPGGARAPQLPATPRFDPIIKPAVLAVGLVGLVVLGGAALLLAGVFLP